ncbi:hypothetical protein CHS0354_031862 [Potamilus streckersoni]|uniref:Ras-associating domain-containing protein n=1 Tax=Potamilus streckersoni TaxID=2493646 RepID=A0AAE0VLW4_9BIVA|nr:hypothetical protein CHS0354_031862 [Potamilus streckersoni]
MADMKKTKLYEVHIFLNAKDHIIKNVTKNSTCDDIIKSLHRHTDIDEKENGQMYALYESMHGVDRELSGKTEIYKLLKKWGSNKDSVQLVLRRKSDIDKKVGVLTQDRCHHRHHVKHCYNHERDSATGNENIRRLTRIIQLQRQRMRSIMESHSKKIPSQEANISHFKKPNPSRAMSSNDLTMQEIYRQRRREEQEVNKNISSRKIRDIVHNTPNSEINNFVVTTPQFTAVKFANSKPLKVKYTNELTMPMSPNIDTRPPCIGQVDPESFGHNHSRNMGDGEYSYYIDEAYSTNETDDSCLLLLDTGFRSDSDLGQRPDCSIHCSALDIGFLEDTLHSCVARIDTENGIADSDKDSMYHSKDLCKFFEKSLNTEIPTTNGKHDHQRSDESDEQSGIVETENMSSNILKCRSINGSMQLVDYSFSDNDTVQKCADDKKNY